MNGNDNGTNLTNPGNGELKPKEKGLAKLINTIRRKYDEIRYSKYGKIGAKVLTAAALVGTGKVCYDKGVKSVKPTVITIEKIPEEDPATEEAPAEEAAEEQTV